MPTIVFDDYGIKIKRFGNDKNYQYQIIVGDKNACLSEIEFRDFILSFCYCTSNLFR